MTFGPFNHPNYRTNQERFPCTEDDQYPCAICGKATSYFKAAFAPHIIDGGGAFGPASGVDEECSGYMGTYPVGSACARKHRAAFAALGYTVGR